MSLVTAPITTLHPTKPGALGGGTGGFGEGHRRVMLHRMPTYGNQRRPLTIPVAITPPESPPLMPTSKPKKTVRFCADNELEQIRLFLKNQMPRAVRSDTPCVALCRYQLKYPDWPVKMAIYKSLSDGAGIRMENIQLDFSDRSLALIGRCRVANLAFEKHVVARYTTDGWHSFDEVDAVYCESIVSTKTWDRFTFRIPLESKGQTIYLALHYMANAQDFWDNNNGRNYQLDVIAPDDHDDDQDTPAIPEDVSSKCKVEAEEDVLDVPHIPPKERTKPLGQRYDFGASLSAARQKSSSSCWAPASLSPPPTPIDEISACVYTPPTYFANNKNKNKNKNKNNHATPTPFTPQEKSTPLLSLSPSSTLSQSQPQPNPVSVDFQTGYQDFVTKYCFYNSPSIYSTSPKAIRS